MPGPKPSAAGEASHRSEVSKFLRSLSSFLLAAGVIWLVLLGLHEALAGIRAGADQVYETKRDFMANGQLFDRSAEARVIIFGDSRVLAGFVPEVFDQTFHGRVSSFNAGIPNATHFVEELAQLVERGETPTHVLLANCWSVAPARSRWDRLSDDEHIIERLFPFRRLPRNMSLFLLRARTRGGVGAYYANVEAGLDEMIENRGYHFIESQSHFPQHRLPEDFRVDQDDSDRARPRPISVVDPKKASCAPQGPVFEELLRLKRSAGMQVALVPYYFRDHEVAVAPPNPQLRGKLSPRGIAIYGPDYFRFPNRLFSDAVHLNPAGADLYTRRLADLLSETLDTDWPRSRTTGS